MDRELPPGADAVQVEGLGALAASRGWQRVRDEEPVGSEFAGQVHRLAWILYGIPFSSDLLNATSAEHRTIYREAWAGSADGHRFLVANAWTNIGPRRLKFYDHQAIAVCVVERCNMVPLWIQPRRLPWTDRHVAASPTGDPHFDDRCSAAFPLPGTGPVLLTAEVRQRLLAHDDWAFVSMSGSLLCASTGPYVTVDSVTSRVEEVLGLIAAIAHAAVPQVSDPATADLIARVGRISSLEEAAAFVVGLNPAERDLLARSGTPLAAFAQDTTPEQAAERFMSLSLTEKMRLYAMMQITG